MGACRGLRAKTHKTDEMYDQKIVWVRNYSLRTASPLYRFGRTWASDGHKRKVDKKSKSAANTRGRLARRAKRTRSRGGLGGGPSGKKTEKRVCRVPWGSIRAVAGMSDESKPQEMLRWAGASQKRFGKNVRSPSRGHGLVKAPEGKKNPTAKENERRTSEKKGKL